MSEQKSAQKKGLLRGLWRGATGSVLAVTGVVLVVVLAVLGIGLWQRYLAPQVRIARGRAVQVRIAKGATTREIASQLLEVGVIGNENGFVLRSRLARAVGKFQPGIYDLKTGTPDREVIAILEDGPPIDYVSVTIPEGFRIDQIADRLSAKADISRDQFIKLAESGAPTFAYRHPYLAGAYRDSLEGYLFPKTYQIPRGANAEKVVEMMLAQFDRETTALDISAAEKHGLTLSQVVVIASMIERESKLDAERSLVSSVIYNRLHRGMRLKIDATIAYVLRSNRFRLTNQDLYTKTPYNTYLHDGLPPGPISNPGLKSLQAAAAPADTAFIYYVLTDKDGSHTFTTNLADFLVAKRKSKEVFGR
jgi:UPF0755 protein